MSTSSDKRFRVALSFTGENRDYVAQVANQLAAVFGQDSILYDKYHEAEFARSDLSLYLPELYHKEADLVVVVICPEYEKKEWTGLEWSAIHDLIAKRRHTEVMLCRFDHASLRGLYGAGYIELDERAPAEMVQLILERLALNEGHPKDFYTSRSGDPPALEAAIREEKAKHLRDLLWANSVTLDSADSFFIADTDPLEREEVAKVVAWVGEDTRKPDELLMAVVGDAGSGKTVILKEVARRLYAQQVPVLAFKADRQSATSLTALLGELPAQLQDLRKLVDDLGRLGMPKLVVFIDQLDALSLSLSSNREPLHAYRDLITTLERLPGVRVVLSCRGYDLLADPALQKYASGHRNIKLERLTEDQVRTVVSASPLRAAPLTPTLLDLLRLPLHLRIFCQLSPQTDFAGVLTLQDLYEKLFEQQVLGPAAPPDLARLLYDMAEQMHHKQTLAVATGRYATSYRVALAYARTNQLIVDADSDRQLQFFHQSFFDYVFARSFVECEQSLTELLRPAINQGLFFRATLRQVLAYQRQADFAAYWQQLQALLTDPAYRWHLRLVVCQFLAQVADPRPAEQDFVRETVLKGEYREPFLEAVTGIGWLKWPPIFDLARQLLRQPITEWSKSEREFLWHTVRDNPDGAITLLRELPVTEEALAPAIEILFWFQERPHPDFATEFDRFATLSESLNPGSTMRMLWRRAGANPEHTAAVLLRLLGAHQFERYEYRSNRSFDYEHSIEELFKADLAQGFRVCRTLIDQWVEQTRMDLIPDHTNFLRELVDDYAFSGINHTEAHPSKLAGVILHHAYNNLVRTSAQDPDAARLALGDWPQSIFCTQLGLVAATYGANPTAFAAEAGALLRRPEVLEANDTLLKHEVIKLVKALAAVLPVPEQVDLWEEIGTRWFPDRYTTDRDVKQSRLRKGYQRSETEYHRYQLWAQFPDSAWANRPAARRLFLALQRRHKVDPNHPPGGQSRVRGGSPAYARPDAYRTLSAADWLAAFRQQHGRTDDWHDWDEEPKASITSDFQKATTAQPALGVAVVRQLLLLPPGSLSKYYLLTGLQGLSESSEADLATLVALLLEAVQSEWVTADDYDVLRMAEKCVERGYRGAELLDFLGHIAKSHAQDERASVNSNGIVNFLEDGINTKGGRAAGVLIGRVIEPAYAEQVEAIIQHIAAHGSPSVRAAALYWLTIRLNEPSRRQAVVQLFCDLIGTDYYLLAYTGDSFSWFAHLHWSAIEPLLEAAVFEPRTYEALDGVLMDGWYHQKPSAERLLRYLWTVSDVARAGTIRFLDNSYKHLEEADKELTRRIFAKLMRYDDEKTHDAYTGFFHDFPTEDFLQWYPILGEFVLSPASANLEYSFFDYIRLCVKDHPAECVDVICNVIDHWKPRHQPGVMMIEGGQPLEILLSAYHVLVERCPSSPQVERVLDALDASLRQARYRIGQSADRKILEALDRY